MRQVDGQHDLTSSFQSSTARVLETFSCTFCTLPEHNANQANLKIPHTIHTPPPPHSLEPGTRRHLTRNQAWSQWPKLRGSWLHSSGPSAHTASVSCKPEPLGHIFTFPSTLRLSQASVQLPTPLRDSNHQSHDRPRDLPECGPPEMSNSSFFPLLYHLSCPPSSCARVAVPPSPLGKAPKDGCRLASSSFCLQQLLGVQSALPTPRLVGAE